MAGRDFLFTAARDASGAIRRAELRADGNSEELAKFLRCEPCIANNSTHRKRVNGIMAGYCQDAGTIGHHDVLA